MAIATLVICPCCGREVDSLVLHHWYEVDGSFHSREICSRCNGRLQASVFGFRGNHLLPSWDEQVRYIGGCFRSAEGELSSESHLDGSVLVAGQLRPIFKCLRCGHRWIPQALQALIPASCPKCHNIHWFFRSVS